MRELEQSTIDHGKEYSKFVSLQLEAQKQHAALSEQLAEAKTREVELLAAMTRSESDWQKKYAEVQTALTEGETRRQEMQKEMTALESR